MEYGDRWQQIAVCCNDKSLTATYILLVHKEFTFPHSSCEQLDFLHNILQVSAYLQTLSILQRCLLRYHSIFKGI